MIARLAIFLSLVFFLGSSRSGAQDQRSDSLLGVIEKAPSGYDVSQAYYLLSEIETLRNPKLALKYINHSLAVYQNADYPFRRYHRKAMIFRILGQVDSSIHYNNLVLNEATRKNAHTFISLAFAEFGLISLSQNNFNKAIEYFTKQLAVIKKNKLVFDLSGVYNNLGIAYGNKGDWDMAKEYFSRSLRYDLANNRAHALGNDYNNLGIVFLVKQNPDSALKYFLKSLEYRKQTNDLLGVGGSLNNLALLENDRGNFSKALQYADSALAIADRNSFKKLQVEVYDTYDQVYSKKGDFKKAYQSLKRKNELNSAFEKEELNNKIQQLESDIELGQKQAQLLEKDLELTRSEQQKQKQLGIIVLVLILLVALSIFMFTFLRNNAILKERNAVIVNQKKLLEEKHKDITDSINYAQKIQSALIISEEKLKKSIPETFVIFRPRDVVSGDFYWYSEAQGYRILALADCTGHGVPGAFMSMIGITLLNQIVNEKGVASPAAILENLRREIIRAISKEASDKRDGMDIAIVAFNETELIFAGANSGAVLIGKEGITELKPNKQPVGRYEREEAFTETSLPLRAGTRLFLFSDGIPDQFGGSKGKKLKVRQLRQWLLESSQLSMEQQKAELLKKTDEWQEGFEQTDDISLIGLKLA